jgi:hypothetical protein
VDVDENGGQDADINDDGSSDESRKKHRFDLMKPLKGIRDHQRARNRGITIERYRDLMAMQKAVDNEESESKEEESGEEEEVKKYPGTTLKYLRESGDVPVDVLYERVMEMRKVDAENAAEVKRIALIEEKKAAEVKRNALIEEKRKAALIAGKRRSVQFKETEKKVTVETKKKVIPLKTATVAKKEVPVSKTTGSKKDESPIEGYLKRFIKRKKEAVPLKKVTVSRKDESPIEGFLSRNKKKMEKKSTYKRAGKL